MKNISKIGLALAVASAFGVASGRAQAPLRNLVSGPNLAHVSDVNGAVPTSADTLLYDSRTCNAGDPLTPIIAPDGHQLTFGEWTDVEGQALVKCIESGSLVAVHLSGLIPNGQYTCWVAAFDPPGFDGTLNNAFTFGPLGLQDGSENPFVANERGEGEIVGILPAGLMSIIHKRAFDGCLTDEFEFHMAVAYHIDGQTHGPTPGPVCTWAVQRVFMFKP